MAEKKKNKKGGVELTQAEYNNQVRKQDDKYICVACGAVVEFDHDCKACGQRMNWGRTVIEYRRGSTGA